MSPVQALWALGNIAADSERTRDLVANHGALFQLLSLMWNPSTRNTSTWNIATCSGEASDNFMRWPHIIFFLN
jgi:hypothetical protein